MSEYNVKKDICESSTLPGEFYKSEATFKIVKAEIFPKCWQLITEEDSVKLSNSVYPFNFMDGLLDEPLMFIKDEKEEIRCLSNVCTHRGNILCEHPCSAKGFTCSYHGRRFKLDGTFVSMPETDGMQNFPCESDNLPNAPFGQWKQFLFASIIPDFPFEELIAEMDARVGWMPFNEFKYDPKHSREYLVHCNWALYCDNYLEGFHIPFVHKDLAQVVDYGDYSSEIYKYANLQLGTSKGGEDTFDLPKSSPDYGKNIVAYYYWLYPNMMFNFYPWGLSVNIVKPLKHNLTKVIFKSYVWDESKMDSGAGSILDKVEREDEAIVERVQKGTGSHFYTQGRFSPKMEQGVHHFHTIIANKLGKLQ